MTSPFAVFAIIPLHGGLMAATTRPAQPGRVGLPGGKVEPGETPVRALIRECAEEGWDIYDVSPRPCRVALVDGRTVWWFLVGGATIRPNHVEQGRVEPVLVKPRTIAESGFGNDFIGIGEWLSVAVS